MRFLPFVPRFVLRCLLPAMLVSGCQADATQAPEVAASRPPGAQAAAGDTLSRLRALAADRSCANDGQCRSLALGATPCGGPEAYLAWSAARAPSDQIEALGKQYEGERREANRKSGMMSTCRFMPDPGAVCRAGVCEAGAAAMQAR